MRIGVMLRHLGEHGGGVDIYTRRVLEGLLEQGRDNHHVFFYRDAARMGAFGSRPNLEEVVLTAPTRLLWDQWAVPMALRGHKIDVLFNPKYSLPLMGSTPSVYVCPGLDWYAMPWGSKWQDRLSHRHLIPRYARKAKAVICTADRVRGEFLSLFKTDPARVRTVYYGVDEVMFEPEPEDAQAELRRRHDIQGPYFLFVGQIYPPKNLGRILDKFWFVCLFFTSNNLSLVKTSLLILSSSTGFSIMPRSSE